MWFIFSILLCYFVSSIAVLDAVSVVVVGVVFSELLWLDSGRQGLSFGVLDVDFACDLGVSMMFSLARVEEHQNTSTLVDVNYITNNFDWK